MGIRKPQTPETKSAGIATNQEYLGIVADYTKSVETVFVEVAQAFLTNSPRDMGLHLLSYCMLFEDSPTPKLPS